jgi:ribosomal protein S18 acetylase RimI-like enzyme
MNLTIRAAGAADRAFIEDLGRVTLLSSVAAFRTAPAPMLERSFERLLSIVYGQSHVGLIAEADELRVGFALMLDELPDEVTGMEQGFIAYMAVQAGRRREGAGAALLKAAEDEARKRRLPYVSLMVTEDNAAARALYERAGYITERRLLCKKL